MNLIAAIFAAALSLHAGAAIVVTEVMSDSSHPGGTNNGDWFELTNSGATSVDITGWTWDDASAVPGSANFGSISSIGAGQSIIVTAESTSKEADWIIDWGISNSVPVVNLGGSNFEGFDAPGDSLNIYNANDEIVTNATFGDATAGSTFEWDTSGVSLGISVSGENGAFVAVQNGKTSGEGPGTDIGSPGIAAIPEPSSCLLIGISLTILMTFRKRTAGSSNPMAG